MERTIQIHDISLDVLMQMIKELLKEEFKEAAKFLKISETTLWTLDKTQVLPATRLNGKVLYKKSELLNFSRQSA